MLLAQVQTTLSLPRRKVAERTVGPIIRILPRRRIPPCNNITISLFRIQYSGRMLFTVLLRDSVARRNIHVDRLRFAVQTVPT